MDTLFTLAGKVVPSSQRGRTLGFPTANLDADPGAIEDGVYLAYAKFSQACLSALLFVGPAVTFGETERKVEVYLLGRQVPVYGDQVGIEAVKKLRDNRKFGSAEELVAQMQNDSRQAREFFSGADHGSSATI